MAKCSLVPQVPFPQKKGGLVTRLGKVKLGLDILRFEVETGGVVPDVH